MKNGNIKTNKTKIVARVMFVVLLISTVINLAGCGEPQVKKGQYYEEVFFKEFRIGFKVVSDAESFPIDDITFSMYIGISNGFASVVEDWFGTLENVYYIIYAANAIDTDLDPGGVNTLDYSYIIKEIPCKEVLDNKEEYNYFQLSYSNRIYNHCETITVPKECIINGDDVAYGDFCLGILVAQKYIENGVEKYQSGIELLFEYLFYYVDEDGTVFIDFTNT